jgi:hypothetical protein
MPFRTKELLEEWIDEFRLLGYSDDATLMVMPQDGYEGADTGLVGVSFSNSPTVTYMQPVEPGHAQWAVTMEARERDIVLDAPGVMRLAVQLTTVSALCAFLQAKSQTYIETHPRVAG